MLFAKFGSNWLNGSGEEDVAVKSWCKWPQQHNYDRWETNFDQKGLLDPVFFKPTAMDKIFKREAILREEMLDNHILKENWNKFMNLLS